MATSPPCISKADIEDSGLAYTSSVIAILTFCFAVGATVRAHINAVHHSCSRFAEFKTVVQSFEDESRWIRDLLRHEQQEPSPPPQPPVLPASRLRPPSIIDIFFDSTQASSSEDRLSLVVDAVDDATLTANETLNPTIAPRRASIPRPPVSEKRMQMRAHLLAEAKKRKTIIAVIEEFRRKQIEKRKASERPVHEQLLGDLEKGDNLLRDIVKKVESKSSPQKEATQSTTSPSSDVPSRVAGAADLENGQNGHHRRRDEEEDGTIIARKYIGTWRWWLGFDEDGHWMWPTKARISRQWQQSREPAMVLKEQRSALSSQVMFAQLTIVQSQIADRVLSDSADSQLIREVAKLRDELASQGRAAVQQRS